MNFDLIIIYNENLLNVLSKFNSGEINSLKYKFEKLND